MPQPRYGSSYGAAYDRQLFDHSRDGPVTKYTWDTVERHLRKEARVLRDHNLVMGNVATFRELHDQGMLNVNKK